MRPALVGLLLVLALPACRFNFTAPSPIINVSNSNTNSNTNNNDNDNDNRVGQPPSNGSPCCPTGGNGSPSGPRPPDPSPGAALPLPAGAEATVRSLGAQFPQLVTQSCQAVFGASAWAFLDKVIDTLRVTDVRWGYVCKYGNCSDTSGDVIAYHATAGPDISGARGTWEVDILGNHCADPGMTTTVQWNVIGFSAAGVWGTRGRF